MTKVQRAAMKLADLLASREIAKNRDTWPTTKNYWDLQVAMARAGLKKALREAGRPEETHHVGIRMPFLPWFKD